LFLFVPLLSYSSSFSFAALPLAFSSALPVGRGDVIQHGPVAEEMKENRRENEQKKPKRDVAVPKIKRVFF